jgi:polyhydroxybutyrate depolymerase
MENKLLRRLFRFETRVNAVACLLLMLMTPIPIVNSKTRPPAVSEAFVVEHQKREALIYRSLTPSPMSGAPLVFVFHGHGGSAKRTSKVFDIPSLWPEAVVVYMQGLSGVGNKGDPEGKKTGWQVAPGWENDRDVSFFDKALARIQEKYKTDPNRVYVFGYSHGGVFVFLLWKTRGDKIAALCSGGAKTTRLLQGVLPKPVFIVAGRADPHVPWSDESAMLQHIRNILGVHTSKAEVRGYARAEPGIRNTELVTYIHPGGHEFPKEALPMIVEFFKRHVKE